MDFVHRLAILAIAMLVAYYPGLPAAAQHSVGQGGIRLPRAVSPSLYRLKVEPNFGTFSFKGDETISINIRQPTAKVILNAAELQIERASILSVTDKSVRVKPVIQLNKITEQLALTAPQVLKPGQYEVNIGFRGTLNDKLRGFYRSTYTDAAGQKKLLAVTQMEPTDARRMFPCFDEPDFKAVFDLTAVIDQSLTAISNSPVESEKTLDQSRKAVHFAPTPKMSTYLVALLIGDFESTEPKTAYGVPVRVWSVKGKKDMCKFALDVGARLIPFYNKYFGIPYPAKKLDFIAIPDFEAGAMENLGAVTYRETALLIDEKTASTHARQRVAGVVAHEMAHMWFGDLVTMKWWDDLWLNEAFATWMATKAEDFLFPEWHSWDQFGLSRAAAMSTDALRSSRAIHFVVNNPYDANEMFDEITYSKGASILRMLEQYVGEEVFRQGVSNYLKAHAFGNATTVDLWNAIGKSSGKPIRNTMFAWVERPGFPLVSVALDNKNRSMTAQQRRFLLDPPKGVVISPDWSIPLFTRSIAEKSAISVLTMSTNKQVFSAVAEVPFVNAGGNGYYRVRYPSSVLAALQLAVQNRLSVAERLSLLSDQWSLVVAGDLPISEYLKLTASYKQETDPSVMSMMVGQFDAIYRIAPPAVRPALARFVQDRVGPAMRRLGWTPAPGESDLTKLLRSQVVSSLGTIGNDASVIAKSHELFDKHLNSPDTIDGDVLRAVIHVVAYNGNADDYQKLVAAWKSAKSPEIEKRNLFALADFRQLALVRRTLELTLSKEVRLQDAGMLLSSLISNEDGKVIAWNFLKKNWNRILAAFPMNMVPHTVSACSALSTPELAHDVHAFFARHPVPAGKRTVARMLERLDINARMHQTNRTALKDWFASWKN